MLNFHQLMNDHKWPEMIDYKNLGSPPFREGQHLCTNYFLCSSLRSSYLIVGWEKLFSVSCSVSLKIKSLVLKLCLGFNL